MRPSVYLRGGRFLFVFKGFDSLSNNRNALPLFMPK